MEKINIAELLKDCPSGMELDCTMYENVYFDKIYDEDCLYQIGCYTINDRVRNSINFTKYGEFNTMRIAKCVIFPKGKTTWEGFQRPFKDGDIVATTTGSWIGITEGGKIDTFIPTYCVIKSNDEFEAYLDRKDKWQFSRLATEKEKEKLFNAIKANGYHWNEETKTLEKVLNKFDITTLKPFDKVLVRVDNSYWRIQFFEKINKKNKNYAFGCMNGNNYKQCIPYEGNEYLLSTTNDCDEFYKTW